MNEPLSLIMQAADFAARRHAGQRRKGVAGEPYDNHLLEVAALLAEATGGNDAALVAAALLHDTLEDTATEYEELDARFGPEIAAVVAAVTDDKSLPKAERKRRQIESAPAASARAKLLKIADKTSNVRALVVSPPTNWDVARIVDYIDWAEKVVAGCRGLNGMLERAFDAAVTDARAAIARSAALPART
jgi:(p)ppGpp synthase/HD superfamily hydrolase